MDHQRLALRFSSHGAGPLPRRGANQFYSIKGTFIPQGGDISAFTLYIPATGAATNHEDIGSKLAPNSYSGLTSADPELGFGSVQLYFMHKKNDGDYLSHIVPSSATASAVTDLKPMSGPGGPLTGGATGYFSMTFAASNIGYGSNLFTTSAPIRSPSSPSSAPWSRRWPAPRPIAWTWARAAIAP